MKEFFKTIWLTVIAFVIITATGCSSDADYFGLDDVDETFDAERTTRASFIDCSEYLTISSFDVEKWCKDDYEAFSIAMDRIGVNFSDSQNKYIFNEPSGKYINISDSLYNCVIEMFERTNSLFASLRGLDVTMVSRMKSSTAESSSNIIMDCVPVAISNMGFNAPSREEAFRRCDEICSDWRENGFPKNLVESLVKEYAPVTTHRNLDFCPEGDTILLNNCVAQIFQGTHTLNAVSVVGGKVIVVQDLSSSPTSYNPITEKFVYRIFPFN